MMDLIYVGVWSNVSVRLITEYRPSMIDWSDATACYEHFCV